MRAVTSSSVTEKRSWLSAYDSKFILATIFLIFFGLVTMYSVGEALPELSLFKKQSIQLILGIVPFTIFLVTPGKIWQRVSNFLYGLNLAILILVIKIGSSGGGATRWLDIGPLRFQPSEMSKVLIVITLSTFFINRTHSIRHFSTFALSFLHILPVMILLFLQPHLGATMTVFVTWVAICIVAGIPTRTILLALTVGVGVFVSAIQFRLLPEYQLGRMHGMFVQDEKTSGYQQMRSEIAFGYGGIYGAGYLKGEQKALRGVPKQQTDFALSVIGEEAGFFGCMLLFAAYSFYFIRGWYLASTSSDLFARMCGIGALSVLAFHLVVNLSMVLGVGPVVGLWLPFISYGGTALWLCLSCSALIINLCRPQADELFSQMARNIDRYD